MTGGCNIGNWSGSVPGTGNTVGDIGWVTTDRGDLHLDCNSVLDPCINDGPYDLDGNSRPSPVSGNWDQGAIELVQVEICDNGVDDDCDGDVDLADSDC